VTCLSLNSTILNLTCLSLNSTILNLTCLSLNSTILNLTCLSLNSTILNLTCLSLNSTILNLTCLSCQLRVTENYYSGKFTFKIMVLKIWSSQGNLKVVVLCLFSFLLSDSPCIDYDVRLTAAPLDL